MCRVLMVCVVLLVAGLPARAEEVPAIPVLKTLEDLRSVAPVRVGDGQEVRIGMTDPADGAPWRLVYCLAADAASLAVNPQGDPEGWLGPVKVRIVGGEASVEVTGPVEKPVVAPGGGEAFYCTAVPVSAKGVYQVEIVTNDAQPRVLFRSALEVKEPVNCVWQRFAVADTKGDAETRVEPHPTAARPRVSGMVAYAFAADAKAGQTLDGIDDSNPLKLSLDMSVAEPKLTIRCDRDMIDSPGEHLLARWWVNGKAIVAAPAAGDVKTSGWRISFAREIQVTFSLPKILGALKPGDRVALQLMYCPSGTKLCLAEISVKKGRQVFVPRIIAHPDTLPRLSDKIEIEVTEGMLKP